jgi:phage repressor protein C with HTH and peptisase S24 domain
MAAMSVDALSALIVKPLTINVNRLSERKCKLAYMDFQERVTSARKRRFDTQQHAAEAIGCSRGTVAMWESGKTDKISGEYLLPVAVAYAVDPEWLTTGKGPDGYPWSPDKIRIPAHGTRLIEGYDGINPATDVMVSEVDVVLSAGNGTVVPEFIETTFQMPFQAYWFDRFRAKPENVKLMRIHGSSMERTLFDGDRAAVHIADKRVIDDRVYALTVGGEAKIKRLYKFRDGSLRIVSDNVDKVKYPDEIVPADEIGSVYIIGRVIDKSGSGGL